jgi:hypothetical protein
MSENKQAGELPGSDRDRALDGVAGAWGVKADMMQMILDKAGLTPETFAAELVNRAMRRDREAGQ